MKSPREFVDYLQDILDALDKAEQFTHGMDFDQFSRDAKTQYAVVRALEVIGEAANKIPISFQTTWPSIPWREMAGMRNKLIHEYFGVDASVVWKTLIEDLPPLKPIIIHAVQQCQ